jgi:hypothetical protein
MTEAEMTIRTRVRLTKDVELFAEGLMLRPGLAGTVVLAANRGLCAMVKLDDHFPELDNWDNELQVGPLGTDEYACDPSYFEPIA